MRARQISIPRLLEVGPHTLPTLAPKLHETGFDTTRVCVGSGDGPSVRFAELVAGQLGEHGIEAYHRRGLDGTLADAANIAAEFIEKEVTLAVGVGGGRVIDTFKLAAARSGTEFVACPTTIAHDGISSPVASLLHGTPGVRRSFAASVPAGVVIDLDVVASAPERTLRAGAGDLASNLTAVLDWRLADRAGADQFDAFSAMIAEHAARSLFRMTRLGDSSAQELLAQGLLLSGLAMAAAGTSRPCSGAEHLISHSLDELAPDRSPGLHGEQVALGALIAAAAHRSPLLDELRTLFGRLALPRAPEEIGLDRGVLAQAVVAAPNTRPDRYTVLSEVVSGLTDAEALVAAAFPSQ